MLNLRKILFKIYDISEIKSIFHKKRNGYIFLEVFSSICIASMVMIVISTTATISTNEIKKIDNRIELSEQFNEIKYFISRNLKNANDINFYTRNKPVIINGEFQSVDEIKTNEFLNDKFGILENEIMYISINNLNKKIYIQKSGGKYEIGNYINDMKIKKNLNGRTYNIEIELKKGNSSYMDKFSVRTKNLLTEKTYKNSLNFIKD